MKIDTAINTVVDTAVTSTALVVNPVVDIEQGKAMIIALASSVIVQLAIKGLHFVMSKISKIGNKNDKETKAVENKPDNT